MAISLKKARELQQQSAIARQGAPVAGGVAGAAIGAGVGSVVPGIGTLAGLGVGQALGTAAGALAGEAYAQDTDQQLNDLIQKDAEAADEKTKKELEKAARLAALDALGTDRWGL
jgi:uncharacterized protein YcfJ